MTRLALVLFSSPALAHPGHGAPEIHWHEEGVVVVFVFFLVVFFIKKALKK